MYDEAISLLRIAIAWLVIAYACVVIAGAFLSHVFTTFGFFTAIGFFITLVLSIAFGLISGDFGDPRDLLKYVFSFGVGYIGANLIGKEIILFVFQTTNDPLAMIIGLCALIPIWLAFKRLQEH